MNKITIEKAAIGIPEIVSIIISEISFHQSMQACDMLLDGLMIPNFPMDLSTVQETAIKHFLPENYDSELDIILEKPSDELEKIIFTFLNQYRMFLDVESAQGNIHNKINQLQ